MLLCINDTYKMICSNPLGNHTFASVKGPEEYGFLKSSLEPVWNELGELIADPTLQIDEKEYDLNIVFGSDYKAIYCTCLYMYMYIYMCQTLVLHVHRQNVTYQH